MSSHPAATLSCFYDLSLSPTGFDFATFLALADMQCRRQGLDSFRVILVPAQDEGFWDRETYDVAMKRARIENLLRPLAELMPACAAFHICDSRDDARSFLAHTGETIFPARYTLERPITDVYQWAYVMAALACGEKLPGWRAPATAREQIAAWIDQHVGTRKIVTITVREASYSTLQNSDIAAWGTFARSLDRARYCAVILRDTEQALSPPPPALEGLLSCPQASLDVRLRAALYERATLNMLSANGPMQLLWLNPDVPSLTFKLVNFADPRGCPIPIRSMGFEIGEPPAGFSARQAVCWTDDEADLIRDGFDKMVARLETKGDKGTVESPFATARRLRSTGRHAAQMVYAHLAQSNTGAIRAAAFAGLELTEMQAPLPVARAPSPEWLEWRGQFARHLRLTSPAFWPDDPEAIVEFGEWYALHQFPEQAEAAFRRVLALKPTHSMAKHWLGKLALERNDFALALELLGEAAAAEPYLARSHDDYGDALMAMGKTSEGRTQFEIAARNDPSDEHARARLVSRARQNIPAAERPIVVLGANGFIGSAVTTYLAAHGLPVRGVGRATTSPEKNVEWRAAGTLKATTDWGALLENARAVIHLAGHPTGADAKGEEFIAQTLARAAKEVGVDRFILLSSIDAADSNDDFGRIKRTIEQTVADAPDPVIIRSPPVLGPGVRGSFVTLLAAVRRGLPLPFATLTDRFSLASLANLIDLIALTLDHPAAPRGTFMLRDDEDVSAPELAQRIARALGRKAHLFPCPVAALRLTAKLTGRSQAAKIFTESVHVDDRLTREQLGWQPRVTLDQTIAETCRWFTRESE